MVRISLKLCPVYLAQKCLTKNDFVRNYSWQRTVFTVFEFADAYTRLHSKDACSNKGFRLLKCVWEVKFIDAVLLRYIFMMYFSRKKCWSFVFCPVVFSSLCWPIFILNTIFCVSNYYWCIIVAYFSVILGKSHYVLYYLVSAMQPRMLVTFGEDLRALPVSVRVGQV